MKIHLLLFLVLISLGASAQSKYLVISSGFDLCDLKNESMSPLTYYGAGANVTLGLVAEREKGIHDLSLFSGAHLATPLMATSTLSFYNVNFEYAYLRRVGMIGAAGIELFGGGAVATRIAIRNHQQYSNNNLDADQEFSLAIAGKARKSIALKKRQLDLSWALTIPVVSLSYVPSYLGLGPEGFMFDDDSGIKSLLQQGEVLSVGRFRRVISEIDMVWNISSGNALALSYRWDYTTNTSGNYISDAVHAFNFGFFISL